MQNLSLISRARTIDTWIKTTRPLYFILTVGGALFLLAAMNNLIYRVLGQFDLKWFAFPDEDSSLLMFFAVVFVGPPLETLLGQYRPDLLLDKLTFFRNRKYLILIASALFFGLNHFYSLFYILYGTFAGAILMYAYMSRVASDKKIFLWITLCHSLTNLCSFLANLYQQG